MSDIFVKIFDKLKPSKWILWLALVFFAIYLTSIAYRNFKDGSQSTNPQITHGKNSPIVGGTQNTVTVNDGISEDRVKQIVDGDEIQLTEKQKQDFRDSLGATGGRFCVRYTSENKHAISLARQIHDLLVTNKFIPIQPISRRIAFDHRDVEGIRVEISSPTNPPYCQNLARGFLNMGFNAKLILQGTDPNDPNSFSVIVGDTGTLIRESK